MYIENNVKYYIFECALTGGFIKCINSKVILTTLIRDWCIVIVSEMNVQLMRKSFLIYFSGSYLEFILNLYITEAQF